MESESRRVSFTERDKITTDSWKWRHVRKYVYAFSLSEGKEHCSNEHNKPNHQKSIFNLQLSTEKNREFT